VRYADDFVVLCWREVATPQHIVRKMLRKLGLEFNEGKTKIVDANKPYARKPRVWFDEGGLRTSLLRYIKTDGSYSFLLMSLIRT